MAAETHLILDRIDSLERALNQRIEDVRGEVARMNISVQNTAVGVVAARLVADEASLKVGQVHVAQKDTATRVERLETAESILAKHYGRSLRWRDVILLAVAIGTVWSIAKALHLIP